MIKTGIWNIQVRFLWTHSGKGKAMEVFNLAACLSLAEVAVFVHVFDTDTYCIIFVMMYSLLIKPLCTVLNFKVFFF